MEWYSSKDDTLAIITAKKHLNSSHGNSSVNTLPNTCVLFEMGVGIRHIEANYNTKVLIEELPCFLYNPKCIGIVGYENLCFACGGYGSPAAVDTLETLVALGVKKIIVVGMCGVFSDKINVGDVIISHKILSEEGTSKHYFENHQYSVPDTQLYNNSECCSFFKW